MGAEINIWIHQAEQTWLDKLYAYAERLSRKVVLPSHDHTHHLRVWNLCKSLLLEISSFNSKMDQSLVEGVLVAAFFHDLGMFSSIREDHGRLSREICELWFRENGQDLPEKYSEILSAIEFHDRKKEKIYESFLPDKVPEILGILSVADDLEALGIIGIYRYAEIYLMRDIPLEELGKRILDNVKSRFKKIEAGCRLCPELLAEYRNQYEDLHDFYTDFNQQLKNTSSAYQESSGPLGVINYIRKHGLDTGGLGTAGDSLNAFFTKLEHELELARH